MSENLIDFVNKFQFSTFWASDVCKLIIFISFIYIFILIIKILIKWKI